MLFQFTPALRRATRLRYLGKSQSEVSIHARLATGDERPKKIQHSKKFQFTPALRRATPLRKTRLERRLVSIHARLATGDAARDSREMILTWFQFTPALRRATGDICPGFDGRCFNSRPPCDGRRPTRITRWGLHLFQFTPALRRATMSSGFGLRNLSFNSRPPCDGRQGS